MIDGQSTYGALVLAACDRFRPRVAFRDGDDSVSYGELARSIRSMAAAFASLGLSAGSSIAILAPNSVHYFVLMAAAALCGVRYTPLHPLSALDDHLFILQDAEVDALVVDADHYGDRAAQVLAAGFAVLSLSPSRHYSDLLALSRIAPQAETATDVAPSDTLAIAFTGGTTGKPKGVVLSHRAVVEAARLALVHWQWPEEVRILLATPMSHAAGAMILPTLLRGGSVFLRRGFDAAAVLDDVTRHGITTLFLVPTMIYLLLDARRSHRVDTSSLRLVLYGAAPMSPARLAEAIEVFGPVFQQIYGQTETSAVLTTLRPEDHLPERLASCGKPLVPENVSLFDRLMLEVAPGEVGEICARGPTLMDGYWKRPDETARTLVDGWIRTGDLARRDLDGFITIVDREKDMVVSGGFNVFPREIEDVLASHPGVRMAVVIGIPDEKWGEVVHALVVPDAAAPVTAETLIALVRTKKGSIHAPKRIEFVDDLPLTPIGKIDKKAVRARYWLGRDRAVG